MDEYIFVLFIFQWPVCFVLYEFFFCTSKYTKCGRRMKIRKTRKRYFVMRFLVAYIKNLAFLLCFYVVWKSFAMHGCLYMLGMTQILVTLCGVLFFPVVPMQIFTVRLRVENGTLTHDLLDVHEYTFGLALPLLVGSLVSAIFVTNTFQLFETSVLSAEQSYSRETLAETGLWDAIFWLFVWLVHLVVIVTVDAPVQIYVLLLALFLQTTYLFRLCAASGGSGGGIGYGVDSEQPRSFAHSNGNILGFGLGLLIMLYNVPSDSSNRYMIFFVQFMFDYFLCIGHTWDMHPRMGTIVNCRLCYACAAPLCLVALYGVWQDRLLF